MRAAAGARTAAADGGTGRITQAASLPAVGAGHRQRQRVHERDRSRLLPAGRDRVHALPPLSQERPGLGGTEEWRSRAPHYRLSPFRGPGSRSRADAVVWRHAAVREFLPTFVQAGREDARRRTGPEALSPPGDTLSTLVGGSEDERRGAMPRQRAARHVGPSSPATANSCGP